MVLDQSWNDIWKLYQTRTGACADAERGEFGRIMFRRRRRHIFPPPLFDSLLVSELAEASLSLVELVRQIPHRFFDGDHAKWAEFLNLTKRERRLLTSMCDPRYIDLATQFARPDFLITESGLRLVEINISAAIGGMATCEPYFASFKKTNYYRYLCEQGAAPAAFDVSEIWNAALRPFTRVSNAVSHPVLFEAIANADDVDASRHSFIQMANRGGFTVASGVIHALRVSDDGVYLDNMPINAVYCMFTWDELRHHVPFSLIEQLVAADRAGLIDFIAPPTSALFDNKANLELLTADSHASRWSASEQEIIRKYVPRTFRLSHDTHERALRDQDQLVLKPACAYGGKGVVFGHELSRAQWESRLNASIFEPGGFVCQERVTGLWRHEVVDGDRRSDHFMSLGGMIFGGRYAGAFVRQVADQGEAPILNAKQGAEVGAAIVDYRRAPAALQAMLTR